MSLVAGNPLSQPIKWHGGKSYLAKRIIELMPPRDGDRPWHLYREPFAGGLAVLLQLDPEGLSEAVNDVDRELANFWRVLSKPESFEIFRRRVECVPVSQWEWDETKEKVQNSVSTMTLDIGGSIDRAVAFFILARQSRQGLMKNFATPTVRLRRGMNENVSAWLTAVDGLPDVHSRLRRIEVRNLDGVRFINNYDDEAAVFYCDPTYMHETRSAKNSYRHEMTTEQHADLLQKLRNIKGRFLLSGYSCPLYETFENECGWRRVEFEIDNKAAAVSKKKKDSGKTGDCKKRKMIECVWMNY